MKNPPTEGFYKFITEKRNDSEELKKVIIDVSNDLVKNNTDDLNPGILLGLIQSGKTRAFIGIMARCFDLGYDVAVVFTKNSVALVDQTIKRLKSEFDMPIDKNKLYVWDVIRLQNNEQLTGYVLRNKIILVVKKEINNLEKLNQLFEETELRNKNVLIIDDEADQASVSFMPDKEAEDGFDFARIATQISLLRQKMAERNSYLQVTATPYSLYLQPEELAVNGEEFAPLRPAFTHILYPHDKYVGGRYYFEESQDGHSPASYIHIQVDEEELSFLNSVPKKARTYDQRVLDNVLESDRIESFRNSIINFLVGGAVRKLQEDDGGFWTKDYQCSFVMHTSTTKKVHGMQKELVECLIEKLSKQPSEKLKEILRNKYHNFKFSVQAAGLIIPSLDDVTKEVFNSLQDKYVGIVEVNSDNQVVELLGEDGQLRLDNPYNIFVGGQSLDRGITIDNLIGFFYGRSPRRFQMDTVLQHSRMYGSRSPEDLAVTRLYTSARIYESMRSMHHFDQDLRNNVERHIKDGTGLKQATAHFIAREGSTIIPAGPNKLRASNLTSFRSHSRLLPIGFQTLPKTQIAQTIKDIDQVIKANKPETQSYFKLPVASAKNLIKKIHATYVYDKRFNNKGLDWELGPFCYALDIAIRRSGKDEVYIYYKEGRTTSRFKHNGASFSDAPDDGRTDLPESRGLAQHTPVIMLLRQEGREQDGWRGTPFYWPVMVMPANTPNYVYCED